MPVLDTAHHSTLGTLFIFGVALAALVIGILYGVGIIGTKNTPEPPEIEPIRPTTTVCDGEFQTPNQTISLPVPFAEGNSFGVFATSPDQSKVLVANQYTADNIEYQRLVRVFEYDGQNWTAALSSTDPNLIPPQFQLAGGAITDDGRSIFIREDGWTTNTSVWAVVITSPNSLVIQFVLELMDEEPVQIEVLDNTHFMMLTLSSGTTANIRVVEQIPDNSGDLSLRWKITQTLSLDNVAGVGLSMGITNDRLRAVVNATTGFIELQRNTNLTWFIAKKYSLPAGTKFFDNQPVLSAGGLILVMGNSTWTPNATVTAVGKVWIYTRPTLLQNFTLLTTYTPTTPVNNALFGSNISASENLLFISSDQFSKGLPEGKIGVFELLENELVLMETITGTNTGEFGCVTNLGKATTASGENQFLFTPQFEPSGPGTINTYAFSC